MNKTILFIALIFGYNICNAQVFIPRDSIIAANVFQVEFSDDSRSMVWCEGLGNNTAKVWYADLNLNIGLPNFATKQLIDTISGQGWPYWGQDQISRFFIIKNQYGEIKYIRRIGFNFLQVNNLGTLNSDDKSLINASSDSTKAYFWLSYVKINPLITGLDSLFVIASNNLSRRYLVNAERKNQAGSAYELTFPRWMSQSEILSYPFRPFSMQPYWDMKFWNGTSQTSRQVTNDIASSIFNHHVDDLPFRLPQFPNDTFLFSSKALQQVAIYQKTGTYFSRVQLHSPITSISSPSITSFEPFTINGNKTYGAYQVYAGSGIPGNTPGEIYLKGIFNDSLHTRISNYNGDVAVDPEYVIGNNKVWIYYYGKPTGPGYFNLHRCETPLVINTDPLNSTKNLKEDRITVYPNPFEARLSVKNVDKTDKVVLYNANGQVLWEGTSIENEDFAHLKCGIYFLTVLKNKYCTIAIKK
jgi:Secretion system C-terminal sorting domain